MLTKSQPDEIEDYLSDASFVRGGNASGVVFPENAEEVAATLRDASNRKTPVTISGAGTGTVAGRVPFGGIVMATDKLNRIGDLVPTNGEGRITAEAGVRLIELQRTVESQSFIYPPDPTERTCFIGGNIATNASGARTFKYGPTRNYVESLKIALASGDLISLRRDQLHADAAGRIHLPLSSGGAIEAQLPTYRMPHVRKHASGSFVAPGM